MHSLPSISQSEQHSDAKVSRRPSYAVGSKQSSNDGAVTPMEGRLLMEPKLCSSQRCYSDSGDKAKALISRLNEKLEQEMAAKKEVFASQLESVELSRGTPEDQLKRLRTVCYQSQRTGILALAARIKQSKRTDWNGTTMFSDNETTEIVLPDDSVQCHSLFFQYGTVSKINSGNFSKNVQSSAQRKSAY